MVLGSIVPSPLGSLTPQQALILANVYLENAYQSDDRDIALVLCHDTEVSLSQAKKAVRRTDNQAVVDGIIAGYMDLGDLLKSRGYGNEAQVSYRKAEKLGGHPNDPGRPTALIRLSRITQGSQAAVSQQHKQLGEAALVPAHIFPENISPPIIQFKLPDPDERLQSTRQLVCCLGLLQVTQSHDLSLEPVAQQWLQVIEDDVDEQERLHSMATDLIRVFKRDELKDAKAITEIVALAPVLDKEEFQGLLREFYSGINHSGLLDVHQLMGLAQMIQGADSSYLSTDDLVRILGLFSDRLRDTHLQSQDYMYKLTLAVSHVLDAMADINVVDLDRKRLHEPLVLYLKELKKSSDPYLVYQAAYAFQALLCVPDDETAWQATLRRSGKVLQGVAGLVSAAKGLDLNKLMEGLEDIQTGLAGTYKVVDLVQSAYKSVTSLSESGQGFFECLKEGLSFDHKREWYSALRGADVLIRDGRLATFRMLVCKAPCRQDLAFQWGICQRLGEIASDSRWDAPTRRGAVEFLGEIYRNDEVWGQQYSIKQWILNILMQITAVSGARQKSPDSAAETLLRELETSGDSKKQAMYRACRSRGPTTYPLKVSLPEIASMSLLDRVQNRPDVEGNIRLLRKHRTKGRDGSIYIQPQAKSGLQAADDALFPLMEKVKEFLDENQKVFLVLGDSGAGKSTFNRQLEMELWQSYKSKTSRIPLFINLPAIDKPEHDMIAKQLRKAEFTEPQIREMKYHRKFILICDGYDESHQTHNLYTSNKLNQAGEWDAQMVISCRTEYLGSDYLDRFQPSDRNWQSDPTLFQEAVITPFSLDQVQTYIRQYVLVHQPLWQLEDYKQALEIIPTLKDLVRNPFLMTLTLEVLPRLVDPGQQQSSTRVTRIALYDHFVQQWLERGKKRVGEKELTPNAREEFERLSEEGFTQNGMDFLKRLSVAIYKNQDGQPVVEYSQFRDKGSWKDEFFIPKDMRLLREACPLTRNGNQHRFIHRSLLEYGLTLAVFDPKERGSRASYGPVLVRRGSIDSTASLDVDEPLEDRIISLDQEPDSNSPLVWRSFVNDYSMMQFLGDRIQEEPEFKDQLLAYIEYSKKDKKWRKAAANAITLLVRSGVQFINTDLQGVRIPGADLSCGVFDSANLQNADLRHVNLRGAWLRQANLSGARMTGVQFGEMPSLTEENEVQSCAYSPDGKLFAAGLINGDINLYSTSDFEKVSTLNGHHTHWIRQIAFSPHGSQLASASFDGTVRLWDTKLGWCLRVLSGHTGPVLGVTYSPLGHVLASAGADNTIMLCDVDTGTCLQTLQGHNNQVSCVTYSPDGTHIASGSMDHSIRLWNLEAGSCGHILSGHNGGVRSVTYSSQGDQVISGSEDTTVRLWDVRTGACHFVLSGHNDFVFSVVYSPKGDTIASSSRDGTVRLWDVETGVCRQTLTGHSGGVTSVVYSPQGSQIASGSGDKTIRLWDVSVGASRVISNGHSASVTTIKCSRDGVQVASSSLDRTVRLWDFETGECLRILRGHRSTVFSVEYPPQEGLVASGSSDRTIRLWDMESGECQHTFTGHEGWVNSISFSSQGDLLVSASEDKTIRMWDVITGEDRGVLSGHSEGVLSVVISVDGSQVASGGKDYTVRIWDTESRECRQLLGGHTSWVRQVIYAPQGRQLASASYDWTVRLWEVETYRCLLLLTGHTDAVTSIAYSPEGNLLASGSLDRTVRLWDVATGQCRAVIENFQHIIFGVAWSKMSDSNYLVTGCGDGSVLKWLIKEEEGQCRVELRWSATNGALTMTGASIQGVRGLASLNSQLMKQRGAIGEPVHPLAEASRRLVSVACAVSKLQEASKRAVDGIPSALVERPDLVEYEEEA